MTPALDPALSVRPVPIERTRELRQAILRPHQTLSELAQQEVPGTFAVGAFRGARLVAVGMITPGDPPDGWRVRGMATRPEDRGLGLGTAVLGALLGYAIAHGAGRAWCNARVPAVGLYARAGFRIVSDEFELPKIGPHVVMERILEPPRDVRLGVLALGDSITNGGGELQWGVAMKSWAEWVARGLGLPYTGLATDGAQVGDVVSGQIARFAATTADPDARYDLGCLYIGVNDVRGEAWDAGRFAEGYAEALGWLAERCARVLVVTVPLDLGRPRAGRVKVGEVNAVIAHAAPGAGASILDLSRLKGREWVMHDHVHLTALGQIEVAERALAVLGEDGMHVRAHPREMVVWEVERWERVRAAMTYGYRAVKLRVGR